MLVTQNQLPTEGPSPMLYTVSVLLLALHQARDVGASQCRLIPEDPAWPSMDVWDSFNSTIGGRLVQTVPVGTPCYAGPGFNEDECQAIRASWRNPDFQYALPRLFIRPTCFDMSLSESSSSSIMHPIWSNHSCDPFSNSTTSSCVVGSYVSYSVNVSLPEHIISATQFVKENNLRLVVRNTAHE